MHKSIGAQIRRILDKVGWEDKTYSLALAEDVGKNSHDDLPRHLFYAIPNLGLKFMQRMKITWRADTS